MFRNISMNEIDKAFEEATAGPIWKEKAIEPSKVLSVAPARKPPMINGHVLVPVRQSKSQLLANWGVDAMGGAAC